MKSFKVLFAMVMALGLILTSCSKDDDDAVIDPTATGPSSFMVTPDSIWAEAGQTYHMVYAGASVNDLVALYVTPSTTSLTDTIYLFGTTVTDSVSFTVPAAAVAGDQYWVNFTLEDTDGELYRAFDEVYLEVIETGTPLGSEVIGTINHRFGANAGAWDLVNNVQMFVADTDANKDMENTSISGGNFLGAWAAGTGNGTTFVEDSSIGGSDVTLEDLEAAHAAGTAVTSISGASAGSTYVAKLRNNEGYARIIVIDVTDNGPNDGSMTFAYKKGM